MTGVLPRGFRGVTFDVGGTLIEPWPSVGHVYAEVAGRHGQPGLDPDRLSRRFFAAWRRREATFDYSRAGWTLLLEETFAGIGTLASNAKFFADLYAHFATAGPWRVFPDVVPVVRWLRERGFKLGVVSNWDDRLRPLLSQLGLAERFDTILVSAELGWRKPDPRIFDRAAAELGLPPDALLHVGDDAAADAQGAQRAGWQAVRIDRRGPDGDRALSRLFDPLLQSCKSLDCSSNE